MRWSIWSMLIFVGFRSLVTSQWHFEKDNQIKTRCRVCLTNLMCMDDIETWGKRPLLACSRNAGDWYKLLKLSKTCQHTQLDSYVPSCMGMRAVDRSYPRPLPSGLMLSRQRCKRCKSGLSSSLSGEHAANRECGYFCTASITELGLSYKPGMVTYHIKEITAVLCHSLLIPE